MSPTLTQSHSHTDNGMEVPAQFERILKIVHGLTMQYMYMYVRIFGERGGKVLDGVKLERV